MKVSTTPKAIKYKCKNCGYEETIEFPRKATPPVNQLCPQCHFLTFEQVKYDYFRDGPVLISK